MIISFFKKIISLGLVVAIFSVMSFPGVVFAQQAPGETEDGLFENESESSGGGGNSVEFSPNPDPRLVQPDDGTDLDTSNIFRGVAQNCLSQLLAGYISGLVSDFANDLASVAIEAGKEAIFGANVPVAEKGELLRIQQGIASKETGRTFGVSQDGLANCLVNALIEELLRATTQWVLNGFEGNPAFIDDPEQFFRDILDNEVGEALNDLAGGYLCEPFSVNIRIALLTQYTGRAVDKCSLSEIIGNFENFIDGNFDENGWKNWFTLTQTPTNNPYGSHVIASHQLFARLSVEEGNAEAEIGWNNGFISIKDEFTGATVTPGQWIAGLYQRTFEVPLDRVTFADEFDELVSALINTVVKIALDETFGEE